MAYDGVLEGLRLAVRMGRTEREAMGVRVGQRVVENFRVEEAAAKGLAYMEINPAAGQRCDWLLRAKDQHL